MATGVGLSIGASESVAAIVTTGHGADPVYVLRDSVLHMSADGAAVLGGVAPAGYAHSIIDFVSFVGSPAGIVVDDSEPYRAEDLVATALFCLINLATEHLVGPAEFYAAHPADWPDEYVTLLRDALDYLGLRSVVLTPSSGTDVPAAKDAARTAALLAHAAVLATPAGTTPPDSGPAENAGIDTAVLPTIDAPVEAQAYSAAPPTSATPPPISEQEPELPPPTARRPVASAPSRRTLLLAAAAVTVLLALAGVGVGIARHGSSSGTSDNSDATVPTSSVARGIPAQPSAPVPRLLTPISAPTAPHPPVKHLPAAAPPPPAPVAAPTPAPANAAPQSSVTDPYAYVPNDGPQLPGMPVGPTYWPPPYGPPYAGVPPYFHYQPSQ